MGSAPATAPSSQFGKYSLVARLATGGMAELFLGRLHGAAGFEKLVCIKRILPHLARDRQFVAMFLDEARIAARITHPNVCQVFELGEIDGSYYLAMEYLEGVPLACFRRHDYYGPAPDPRLVAGIAIQACEGLHHAHQLRHGDGSVMEVVHRDVSPQNLFVTADGIVKVLDFGIAKIQGATVRTSTGAIKGTYAYMAPEQLRGERVDRRTDVFAMGIVLWETLTRRYLFKRDTEFLTFQAITAEPIEDVCALRPDVPPALSAVILTALARDRNARFPTVRMLGEAIAAAVPPLSSAAISEEIARAFPGQLAEQAALIRVAREGGAFDLDVERGPSVGHGADLLTTPVSNQRGAEPAPAAGPAEAVFGAATVVSATRPPAPASLLRRVWRPLAIAAVALALVGAGAYVARITHEPAAPAADVAASPTRADAAMIELSETALPAPAPPNAVPGTAGNGQLPGKAPGKAPDNVPGNAPDRPADQGPDRPADRHAASSSRPVPAARPSGPPGFITIDSSPVYAVIYIDGKRHGETPLVRIELSPGRHVVHAVAPSGATRDVRITIEPGKVAPASRIVW